MQREERRTKSNFVEELKAIALYPGSEMAGVNCFEHHAFPTSLAMQNL